MKMNPRPKNKRVKSKKITQSARDEDCTLRLVGVCNYNPQTTVFAHVGGGGMGIKRHDISGCYACSNCHTYIDSMSTEKNSLDILRAMIETQSILLKKGLINI